MNTVKQSSMVSSFNQVDMSGLKMPMIVVYEKTEDRVERYLARLWDMDKPTNLIIVGDTINEIREKMPLRFFRLERSSEDDLVIVEVWM